MSLYRLEELDSLKLDLAPGDRVYLYGDLGSGKTTLTGKIITKLLGGNPTIKSPTYVYYRAYPQNIYHFDLYRVEDYDTFVAIGGEEILENPLAICFVEWPEKIESRYSPTVKIFCEKTEDEDTRSIRVERV